MPLPDDLTSQLDLDLGLRRALADVTMGQSFFRHPHELALIDVDRPAWLAAIRRDLATYVPGDLFLCNAVKPKRAIRPGGILSLRDQTVYAAVVSALSERIRISLDWGSETVDFSYPVSPHVGDPQWFANFFPLWTGFADQSLSRIRQWADPVVFVDIAAYYECIDIGLLLSDLRGIGAPPAVLELLSRCLNKWSQASVPGRSVPQGFSASNLLARFYLNWVDRALRERGVHHLRYVDDLRLFCRSQAEAQKQLVELIVLLRKRGLAIQTAKLDILGRDAAVARIEGLLPALRSILKDFVDSLADWFDADEPYMNLAKAEEKLAKNPQAAPIGLIREAYRRFFLQQDRSFDKTLFHFLLRKLGKAEDDFAFSHALTLLSSQPQETREVLHYLTRIGRVPAAEPSLVDYLESSAATYPHQFYEIISWRIDATPPPGERFLQLVRRLLYETAIAPYLRSVCREFLGRYGTATDIDRAHDTLSSISDDFERAELLCTLRRMESGRRNGILARYASAGPYTDRAISLVRKGSLPGA
jgi:hypothetical protein